MGRLIITCMICSLIIIFNGCNTREIDKKQTELESSPFIDKNTNEGKDEEQQILDEPGNTTGNISNYAYVAKKGEWIYYNIAPTLRNYRDGMLYKEKFDGTGRIKICDDAAIYINIVGDWVFYSNRSDSRNGNGGKIYKIRKDGTSRTKVNNKDSAYINIVNGWIYYTNLTDGDLRNNQRIYKMKVDGTSITKLNDDESSHVNVIGDWIYYLKWEYNDEGFSEAQIYKMKTDGTKRSKIIEEYTRFMFTDGEWIFYNNMNDEERLYKVLINDTNKNIRLTDEKIKFINALGDRLIYIVYKSYYKSGDQYLCSMKFDGTDKKTFKLFECNGGINIIDDWIHFHELHAEEVERRAIKLDGSVVKDMWSNEIIWSGETIWTTTQHNK